MTSRVSHLRAARGSCRGATLGDVLFVELATASRVVASTSKRSEKVSILAAVIRRATPDELAPVVAFATGSALQGRIGVGWATIADVRPAPAAVPTLAVLDVHRAVDDLAGIGGGGSVARRRQIVHTLLAGATEPEQHLVRAILGGELRQGALDGVMAARSPRRPACRVVEVQRGCDARRRRSPTAPSWRSPRAPPARCDRARPRRIRSSRCSPRPATTWPRRSPPRAGVGRVEARRRPHPGAPRRRRGAARSRATSTTSPTGCAGSSTSSRSCPAATSCSTARRSASPTTAPHAGSRTRWATSVPRRPAAARVAATASARSSSTCCTSAVVRCSTSRCRCDARSWPRPCRRRAGCRRSSTADADEAERVPRPARSAAGHEGVMVKALDRAVRRRPPRRRVAQGEAGAHARSRRARRRVGPRPAPGLAVEPAPRRPRCRTASS